MWLTMTIAKKPGCWQLAQYRPALLPASPALLPEVAAVPAPESAAEDVYPYENVVHEIMSHHPYRLTVTALVSLYRQDWCGPESAARLTVQKSLRRLRQKGLAFFTRDRQGSGWKLLHY